MQGKFDSVNLKAIEQLYRRWKAINAWNALCNAQYLPPIYLQKTLKGFRFDAGNVDLGQCNLEVISTDLFYCLSDSCL